MQALTIQLQESSPTLNKMSEVKLKRDKRSLIVSVMLFPNHRYRGCLSSLTLRANRRNLVDHWTPNIVGCYMLRPFAHPVACCWILLRVVAQSLKPVKLFTPFKRTQHCWLTTPKIVGCYMLRPCAHPVACCWMLLRVVAQSLKPVKLLAPCKRTQHCWLTTPNIVGSCCARLHEALGYCSFQSTWQPDLHALTKLCLHCWF